MFLNKRPETPGQNFKYVSKQHSKIPGLQNLIFKEDLQCFTLRFCFSGLSRKKLSSSIVYVQQSKVRLLPSVHGHPWLEEQEEQSQLSSCCHTALVQSKCLLQCWSALTIVSCQLAVALEVLYNGGRRGSGKGAAPAPAPAAVKEQTLGGALKCHILLCCSCPLLGSDWGHSPGNNSFLTPQTRF